MGKNHYGEACTRMRICGVIGCKDHTHKRLLHRDKLVRTKNEERQKKKKAP